ncbi:coiled-coil domain containing 88A [Megalops cyprinoides]|uniref:coiled-coil domain containing 88A n=1 Tax=Megalops cyprinoides TaxID=118141 RepID=UPI0018649A50|nr:coiled-coil domain containing 88A [Megalops cyprinoides]
MERVTKMDAHFSDILEEFMRNELVTWVHLFDSVIDGEGDGPLSTEYLEVNSNSQQSQGRYLRLTNGIFLNKVMRIIDPNPKVEQIFQNESNDEVLRVQNFSVLNRHLRSFYQEDLQQLLLMPLPNVAVLGRDPLTEAAVEELRRLLLLLLGCAVQCERKEVFIQQIQSLEIETQAAIATCIQEITQDLSNVLPLQWEELCALEGSELQGLFSTMAQHIQGLLSQRDTHLERIAELSVERDSVGDMPHTPSPSVPEGMAVQLADCRAKLRRLRQDLEDKGDQLLDYKQEVHAMEVELKKLRQENRALQGEARAARGLRDELDCLRERAAKADRLQAELQSCAHRLRSLDLYRTQLQEQQQYCATLQETRALLEEQLGEVRARCSSLRELERDNLLLRQRLIDLEGERDAERQRVDELLEENMSLEAELKHSLGGARNIQLSGMDSGDEFIHDTDLKPLSVEVSEASSWKLLGAETENAELRRRLEQLQAERELCTEGVGPTQLDMTELLEESLKLKEELQKQTVTQTSLEAEYQNTLKELQNLKDENSRLRSCLESLRMKQQWEEKGEKTAEEERSNREAEEKETQREEGEGGREGEGKVTGGERQGKEQERESGMEGIRTKREDGEGEEVLSLRERVERFKQVQGDQETEPKERDEGEREKESGGVATAKELSCRKGETGSMLKTKKRGESLKEREATEGEEEREMKAPRGLTEDLEGDGSALASQLQRALLEVEQQSQECNRQAGLAQELQSRLAEQNQRALSTEQRLSVLEAENLHLKKTIENMGDARKQIETLQAESVQMEEELARLRSQAELHRLEAAMITQLQGERAQLEQERDALRSSTDTLRAAARKVDQLELTNQSLKVEVERLERSLESSRRREADLEAELREAGLEAESLGRGRDQAVLEAARLEQEKEVFQSQLDAYRREGRQREREAARLRQQLESTASALECSNQRACSLEAEHRQVCQELSQLQEDCTKLRENCAKLHELERENSHLSSLNSEAQSQLSTTAQELVNEKTQSQEWAEQVAKLSQRLERLQAEQSTALSSSLSPMLKGGETETDTASLIPPGGARQSKLPHTVIVNETEPQTQEPSQLPGAQISDSPPLPRGDPRLGSESTPLSQGESGVQSKLPQNTDPAGKTPTHQMKNETLPGASALGTDRKEFLSERLVEVERQNTVLQTERDVLRLQLQQVQSTCAHLQEQLDSLHRHSIALQENCANLQALNGKLQTEQATLSSQHALVWARCSESEARVAALEAESKVWGRDREEVLLRGEGLRRDHERLTALQQRQEAELEALLSKHSQLKANFRNLEMQHRELEGRYRELSDRRAQLEEGEAAVQAERARMERDAQTQEQRERELERLREENDGLHALQKESVQVQAELLAQGSVLRGELSAAQLERTRLEGELSTLREQNQHLDLNNARLASQYQLLTQLKGNMEEETRHLMEQNQNLARENRALLERSLESRDQHHLQQREYLDKLNELRREKQKLVEKIMDQYRVLEPSVPLPNKTKKSNWIADRMKKLIKPRGGREVREGRAQFIAAGSVENLTEASDYTQYAPAAQQDPLSAPVSPSPLRKSSSTESEEQARVVLRSGRRKLGSRHGWGLGRGRGGVSQSFSPGDQRPCPRDRFHSQGGATAIWQSKGSSTPSHESLVEEEKAECEDNVMAESKSDPHRLSSGPEESLLSNDKSLVTKTDSLQSI